MDKYLYEQSIKMISLGAENTAILKNNGRIKIFGQNNYGQCDLEQDGRYITDVSLGDIVSGVVYADKTVSILNIEFQYYYFRNESIITLSSGYSHFGLLYQEGYVHILGYNSHGQCDLTTLRNEAVSNISLGSFHTAILYNEGYVTLFGDSDHNKTKYTLFKNSQIIKVVLGGEHSGFLYIDQSIDLIGNNDLNQLDFLQEKGNYNIVDIDLGYYNTAVIYENRTYNLSVGEDQFDQLRYNQFKNQFKTAVKQIKLGDNHTGVLYNNGTVLLFGSDEYGQCKFQREFLSVDYDKLYKISRINYY